MLTQVWARWEEEEDAVEIVVSPVAALPAGVVAELGFMHLDPVFS